MCLFRAFAFIYWLAAKFILFEICFLLLSKKMGRFDLHYVINIVYTRSFGPLHCVFLWFDSQNTEYIAHIFFETFILYNIHEIWWVKEIYKMIFIMYAFLNFRSITGLFGDRLDYNTVRETCLKFQEKTAYDNLTTLHGNLKLYLCKCFRFLCTQSDNYNWRNHQYWNRQHFHRMCVSSRNIR